MQAYLYTSIVQVKCIRSCCKFLPVFFVTVQQNSAYPD